MDLEVSAILPDDLPKGEDLVRSGRERAGKIPVGSAPAFWYASTTRRKPGSNTATLGPSPRSRQTFILCATSAKSLLYT